MSFSDAQEAEIIRNYYRNTAPAAPPATVYVALYLTLPGDDGSGGTEVSTAGGTNYVRQPVTTGTSGTGVGSGWADPGSTSGQTNNIAAVNFPISSASYGGAIVGVGLWRVVSGGASADYMGGGPSTDPTVTIGSGQQYVIPAASLLVTQT